MKKLIDLLKDESDISEAPTTDLAVVGDLQVAIEEYLESTIKPRYKKSTGFAPSESNTCARFWWYKFTGVEFPVSHNARSERIFSVGNSMHERYQKYFDDMGVLVEAEMPLPQREGCPPVSGFIDAVIKWGDDDVVVELKSIKHEGFLMRKTYKKPTEDHYRQIQWYMHYTGIEKGIVLYECKNTQEILVFKIRYDKEFCEKLVKKYDKLYKKAIGDKPNRPYGRSSQKCQYCKLLTVCWTESENNDGETM